MEIARGIEVPFNADTVASPVIWYSVPVEGGNTGTCMLFVISDETEVWGRVLFEGFDAIRCCRGEYMPYKDDWAGQDYARYPWVWEIAESAWLQQRHEYEDKHYRTPLLDEYVHYLFSFHDEFVELIAKGIWFDKVKYDEAASSPAPGHPLCELPESAWAEDFTVSGIQCSVRYNPLPQTELLVRSRLCSQAVFQYYMTLDGRTTPSYAAVLRTTRGRTVTRLRGGLFYKDLRSIEGVGKEAEFRLAFSQYVLEVADRRRKMGRAP